MHQRVIVWRELGLMGLFCPPLRPSQACRGAGSELPGGVQRQPQEPVLAAVLGGAERLRPSAVRRGRSAAARFEGHTEVSVLVDFSQTLLRVVCLSTQDAKTFFEQCDTNSDGLIDFEDFFSYLQVPQEPSYFFLGTHRLRASAPDFCL